MKYIYEKRKKLNKYISILLLFILIQIGVNTPIFSWYTYTAEIPNMKISTGTLDLGIEPKHIKVFTNEEETSPQIVKIIDKGTLPLKYTVEKINKSHDCQYVGARITINGGTQYISLGLLGSELIPTSTPLGEDTFKYVFFLKEGYPKRNINCEINIHLRGWQSIFPTGSEGFTDKEIFKVGILFKNTVEDLLEMSEVKSFPTSDAMILPQTLL